MLNSAVVPIVRLPPPASVGSEPQYPAVGVPDD
jgi:hypothetical protein